MQLHEEQQQQIPSRHPQSFTFSALPYSKAVAHSSTPLGASVSQFVADSRPLHTSSACLNRYSIW
eukprot:2554714-Lingulodinium_polyedra.AAC.1